MWGERGGMKGQKEMRWNVWNAWTESQSGDKGAPIIKATNV